MKVVDHIDTEKRVSELNDGEREDVFTQMVMGKDVIGDVETSRGKFTVKYPKYKESGAIGRLMAIRRNGIPAACFDAVAEKVSLVTSTLDILIVSGPEWYESAKKNNENFTFAEVPDDEFLEELYLKAYTFRTEVRENFSKREKPDDSRVPAAANAKDTVAGRSSEGIAEQQKNS
jgi:hypothetical protein